MNNHDITFSLSNEYEHRVINYQDNYYRREYIYNFEFSIHIQNNTEHINNVSVYKNGELYADCDIVCEDTNYYIVKDRNVVRKGNFNYGFQILLNGGKTYYNSFNLKILNTYIPNDIKIKHFSTYGLHENMNVLNILLDIQTQYEIDSVKLFNHYCPLSQLQSSYSHDVFNNEMAATHFGYIRSTRWSYLGEMERKDGQYVYQDLLFDTSMNDESRVLLYRVLIETTNGLQKEKVISTLIKPNSFSLNRLSFLNTHLVNYDFYGGLAGRIHNSDSQYNDKIFELVIDKRNENTFIDIIIHHEHDVMFHAEQFNVSTKKYNKIPTNIAPNVIDIVGNGVVKCYNKISTCEFDIRIICGDDYFVVFDIRSQDEDLSIKSNKTANNVIRYKTDDEIKYFDAVYEDKTVSEDATRGYFIHDNGLWFSDEEQNKSLVEYGTSRKYFESSKWVVYDSDNFYFMNYDNQGIYFTRFDGINYDILSYPCELFDETIDDMDSHISVAFDDNNYLRVRLFNQDNEHILQKIIIEDHELSVVDMSSILADAFNDVKISAIDYMNNITQIIDGYIYSTTFDSEYTITDRKFSSMNQNNFVQDFTMQDLCMNIKMHVSAEYTDDNGITYYLNAPVNVTTHATVKIFSNGYDVEQQWYEYDIDCDEWKYSYTDEGEKKNVNPALCTELLNKSYYLRYESPVSSVSVEDYGYYRDVMLYNRTTNMYTLSPSDVYGNGTGHDTIQYNDAAHMRIVVVEYPIVLLMNVYDGNMILTRINVSNQHRLGQTIIKSNVLFDVLYSYTIDQLYSFDQLLTGSYKYDTTQRKLKLISSTELFDSMQVSGISDNVTYDMNEITSVVLDAQCGKSFVFEDNVGWPLNIKNKNDFLNDIKITGDTREVD